MKKPFGMGDGSKKVTLVSFDESWEVEYIFLKDVIWQTSSPPRSIVPLAKPSPVNGNVINFLSLVKMF